MDISKVRQAAAVLNSVISQHFEVESIEDQGGKYFEEAYPEIRDCLEAVATLLHETINGKNL